MVLIGQAKTDYQREYRRRSNKDVTVTPVTVSVTVTNPCKYCGKQLKFSILECCYECALNQPSKVSPAKNGHTLSSRPALEFTGKMTVMERLFYRPVSQLKPGETNFVSLPGRACYGVY